MIRIYEKISKDIKTSIVVFIKTHGTQIYQNNPMTHFFSKTLKLMGPIVGTQGNLHNSWDKLKNLTTPTGEKVKTLKIFW